MNHIQLVTKIYNVDEQNQIFIVDPITEQMDFRCGVIGDNLNCSQPKRDEIVISHCDCCNRYFLIMNGNSYEFIPTVRFERTYRMMQRITCNNWRKMHHMTMMRWKAVKKKGKVN